MGLGSESSSTVSSLSSRREFLHHSGRFAAASALAGWAVSAVHEFATFVHDTKCAGQFSGAIHAATVNLYKDQRVAADNIVWQPAKETANPWQAEWNVLLDAIRSDRPHNETQRAAYSNLAGLMGRAAEHS